MSVFSVSEFRYIFWAEVRGLNNKRKSSLGNAFLPISNNTDLSWSDTAKDDTLLAKARTS